MAIKFGRRYELVVGDYIIKDVRVRFTCEYQTGGFIPLFQIEIYNLSKNTVNEVLIRDTPFEFSAGYVDNLPVIFKGEIRNVFTVREDVDLVTNLIAGGSDQQMRESWIKKTLDNAKNLRSVIDGYLSDVGLVTGEILIKETRIEGSISVSNTFFNVMNNLSKSHGFNWFIYNNLFYAYDKKQFPDRAVYKISTATGLLEVPILTDLGIDVRTLMEPSIRPQDQYEVESAGLAVVQNATPFVKQRDNVRGRQSVFEVKHFGDTHSNAWYTELRGIAIGN